jgi:outer membrane lipoprotein-sorting protein
MRVPDRGTAIGIALILGAILVGAYGALQPPADSDEKPALPGPDEAVTRYERLESIGITRNISSQSNGAVTWTRQRIERVPSEQLYRSRIIETGLPGSNRTETEPFGPGSRIISNGSVLYLIPAGQAKVTRQRVDDDRRDNRTADLRRLFAELNDSENGTLRRPKPELAPLSVARPARDNTAEQSEEDSNESVEWRTAKVTAQYTGVDRVGSRSAYVINLSPATNETEFVSATLWLDTEYLFTVKRHSVVRRQGERVERTMRVQNVTINPEFPPDRFQFDLAQLDRNVSVVDIRMYDSRREMVANVEQSVPDPEIPEGYEFSSGAYTEPPADSQAQGPRLSLRYTGDSPGDVLSVTVQQQATPPENRTALAGARTVRIGDRTARLRQFQDNRFVRWTDDGRQFSVTGRLTNETLLQVARSLITE